MVSFRAGEMLKPEKLFAYIAKRPTRMKLRPDEKLVVAESYKDAGQMTAKLKTLLHDLAVLHA